MCFVMGALSSLAGIKGSLAAAKVIFSYIHLDFVWTEKKKVSRENYPDSFCQCRFSNADKRPSTKAKLPKVES